MDSGKNVAITTTKIIVFIIVMVGFIALAFFLKKAVGTSCTQDEQWSPENKKCRPNCAPGQTYYPNLDQCRDCPPGYQLSSNGLCVQQCTSDQSLCGTDCYNTAEATCLDGVLCDNVRYNTNLNTCCPPDTLYKIGPSKYFPRGVPDSTTIKDFISQMISAKIPDVLDADVNAFGDVLIKAGIPDVASLKDPSKVSGSTWGKATPRLYQEIRSAIGLPFCYACPNSSMCDSICCPDGTTCVSKSSGGNVCCLPENIHIDPNTGVQVCCKVYSDIQKRCCDDGQILDNNGLCANPCGDTICTPPKTCVSAQYYDSQGKPLPLKQYCVDAQCTFTDFEYNPRRVQDVTGKSIEVCKHKDDLASQGPFAYCQRADIADYVLTASDTAKDVTKCGLDDCLGRVKDTGRMSASWDAQTGKCTEQISCIVGDGVSEVCPATCPASDASQCCMDTDNKPTGLICPKDQACFLDENGKFSCAVGFKPKFSDKNMKWECVGTVNPLESIGSKTVCDKALALTVGSAICDPNNPGAWTMKNGLCYRNLPTSVGDIGDNQPCGSPEQQVVSGTYHGTYSSDNYRFCADVYNQVGQGGDCADFHSTFPYGSLYCREHDQGETPNWVQCTDKNGCTTDMCGVRYNFPTGGGPLNICKMP